MDPEYLTGIFRYILFGLQSGQKEFGFTWIYSQLHALQAQLTAFNRPFYLSLDSFPKTPNDEVTVHLLFEAQKSLNA